MTSLILQPALELTDEQFYQICQQNRDLKLEKTARGELIIMPLTGGTTGNCNVRIAAQLGLWSDRNDLGLAFDSSTCFKLPNGAQRSPDVAWIVRECWDALSQEQQEKFLPLCPNFVVELRCCAATLAGSNAAKSL